MGIETEMFAGTRDDLAGVLPAGPSAIDGLPSFISSPLDPVQLASLGQLLIEGALLQDDRGSYGPTYDELIAEMVRSGAEQGEAGPWIFPVPDRLTAALATVPPEQVGNMGKRWREAREVDSEWGSGSGPADLLRALADLARAASRTGKGLYLWARL
jgi:hypothetical protein